MGKEQETPLKSLIGKDVSVKGLIKGKVTAVREAHPLPSLVGGETWKLPPYVEIDGDIQVPPHRVEVDK